MGEGRRDDGPGHPPTAGTARPPVSSASPNMRRKPSDTSWRSNGTGPRWEGRKTSTPLALRVTTIFRREDGTWRVILRHADPITSARPRRRRSSPSKSGCREEEPFLLATVRGDSPGGSHSARWAKKTRPMGRRRAPDLARTVRARPGSGPCAGRARASAM